MSGTSARGPDCVPAVFGPHITPHCPAAPWHLGGITLANLGWWLLGMVVLFAAVNGLINWVDDRWEITPCAPWRYRVTRRWYGTHARVCLRKEAGGWGPARYTVLGWDDDGVLWLKVHRLDPDHPGYWDDNASAFWAPVTDFVPDRVRRFRPRLVSLGCLRVPVLTGYRPVPFAVDTRTVYEINTAYYLNMAAWKPAWYRNALGD